MTSSNGILSKLSSVLSRSTDSSDETPLPSRPGQVTATPSPAEIRLRIADFQDKRVDDVMIPRAEIIAVDEATTLSDLIKLFAETTHSRLPIYRETLDDPVGLVHIKDVVSVLAGQAEGEPTDQTKPLIGLRRDILYVPPSMRLPDLLLKMQSTRIHLSLVVDEYGGTDGLVSLEDLVEQIVGEIEDEHDDEESFIIARGKGLWEVDARAEITEFSEEAGLDLGLSEFEDEIDTLGGIAFAIAGRVPQRGEIIQHPLGLDMEILEADTRRIRRLRIRSKPSTKPSANTETDTLETEGTPS